MNVPRMQLVLSENWTMTPARDLPVLVRWAREAEEAGFDSVMISEHVVLGPDAGARGRMANPREYALPGNQDPFTPWPSPLTLLAAISSVTSTLRLAAAAVLAPLRHPLLLARELGTLDLLAQGRLIVLPTVSWSRDEYAALGVDFGRRGRMLDEHLEIWELLWRESPVSYHGEFYRFDEVYFEPKAYRPTGPVLWFGGAGLSEHLLRRVRRWGSGFNPLGYPPAADIEALLAVRPGLELAGGTRALFPDAGSCAPLGPALEHIPQRMAEGYTTFCIKPSQFLDDPGRVGAFCHEVMRRVRALV
ncbi:TIGR03619 family F420-dependent LLM class oxidoreductase [Nonomuraea sp. NPDC050328]|uniref:TIGR03619 family F420-dependent LLM class oxidoreductase n=1 Tax=Nonomuraea sp. NPDC050328 TaxID=3364361 RepID=UPI0037A89C6B